MSVSLLQHSWSLDHLIGLLYAHEVCCCLLSGVCTGRLIGVADLCKVSVALLDVFFRCILGHVEDCIVRVLIKVLCLFIVHTRNRTAQTGCRRGDCYQDCQHSILSEPTSL